MIHEELLGSLALTRPVPPIKIHKLSYPEAMVQIESPILHTHDRPMPVPLLHLYSPIPKTRLLSPLGFTKSTKSHTRNRSIPTETTKRSSAPMPMCGDVSPGPRVLIKLKAVNDDEEVWKEFGPNDGCEEFRSWVVERFGLQYTPRVMVDGKAVRFGTDSDMRCLYEMALAKEVKIFIYERP